MYACACSDLHAVVVVDGASACSILLVLLDRSRALKELPGPKYSLLGLLSALRVKDPHRLAAAWADQYGPLVKLRLLFFHVNSIPTQMVI